MSVRTADRTLDILECFGRLQKPMTAAELARELSLPASTCFSLVRTLVDRGYLYYLQPRGPIYPTRRVYQIAESIIKHDPIAQYLQPILNDLRDKCGESVILGKLQGAGVLYLEMIESRQPIRFMMQVGAVRSIHASSIGKAILSVMDEPSRDRLLARIKYPKLTDRTIRTRAELLASVEEGRKRGFWMNISESNPDVSGMAKPLTMFGDYYGVALIGPSFRVENNLKKYALELAKAAQRINAACMKLDKSRSSNSDT